MGTANASGLGTLYQGINELGALMPPRESWQVSSYEAKQMARENNMTAMQQQSDAYVEQQNFNAVMKNLGLSESLISSTMSPYAARESAIENGIGMRHWDNPVTRRKAHNNLTLMRGKR